MLRCTTAVSARATGQNCPYTSAASTGSVGDPAPLEVQLNPDVTVRQLASGEVHDVHPAIVAGKDGAKERSARCRTRHPDRLPADVPDAAITFATSRTTRARSRARPLAARLHVLDELGTRVVTYLKRSSGTTREPMSDSRSASPTFAESTVTSSAARAPGNLYFAWMCVSPILTAESSRGRPDSGGAWASGKRTPRCGDVHHELRVLDRYRPAGTLISAILYLFRARWRTSIYRARGDDDLRLLTRASSR